MASDVVERLRKAAANPTWHYPVGSRVELSSDDDRAILLRLECAEERAKLLASMVPVIGMLNDRTKQEHPWYDETKAVLAKWEAMKR